MKKWLYNLTAVAVGIVISLILAEVVLHIYNPFMTRIRGNHIVLPANLKYEFSGVNIRGLDQHIIHHKNALGFRGPEWRNDGNIYKIICVGGSTTECFYLSDGHDWPAVCMDDLNTTGHHVLVENAGLDGHSTRGHLLLLNDHIVKLKPDMVIFLTGCNDVAAAGINRFENGNLAEKQGWKSHSELYNLYRNFQMSKEAGKRGVGHQPQDFPAVKSMDTTGWEKERIEDIGKDERSILLKAYGMRLEELGKRCTGAGIKPVFVTQPTVLMNATDSETGRYLGNMEFLGKSALHYFAVLDSYNREMKKICLRNNWICIDAAQKLVPSSLNYYDFFHYTNTGSAAIAGIIADELTAQKAIP